MLGFRAEMEKAYPIMFGCINIAECDCADNSKLLKPANNKFAQAFSNDEDYSWE